jgi:hypothetical protein
MVLGSGSVVPPFLTSVLDGGERSASRPYLFTSRYPLERRLSGPRDCLAAPSVIERRRPVRSPYLYRLSLPTEFVKGKGKKGKVVPVLN